MAKYEWQHSQNGCFLAGYPGISLFQRSSLKTLTASDGALVSHLHPHHDQFTSQICCVYSQNTTLIVAGSTKNEKWNQAPLAPPVLAEYVPPPRILDSKVKTFTLSKDSSDDVKTGHLVSGNASIDNKNKIFIWWSQNKKIIKILSTECFSGQSTCWRKTIMADLHFIHTTVAWTFNCLIPL